MCSSPGSIRTPRGGGGGGGREAVSLIFSPKFLFVLQEVPEADGVIMGVMFILFSVESSEPVLPRKSKALTLTLITNQCHHSSD